jgi:hypothetical protein
MGGLWLAVLSTLNVARFAVLLPCSAAFAYARQPLAPALPPVRWLPPLPGGWLGERSSLAGLMGASIPDGGGIRPASAASQAGRQQAEPVSGQRSASEGEGEGDDERWPV